MKLLLLVCFAFSAASALPQGPLGILKGLLGGGGGGEGGDMGGCLEPPPLAALPFLQNRLNSLPKVIFFRKSCEDAFKSGEDGEIGRPIQDSCKGNAGKRVDFCAVKPSSVLSLARENGLLPGGGGGDGPPNPMAVLGGGGPPEIPARLLQAIPKDEANFEDRCAICPEN